MKPDPKGVWGSLLRSAERGFDRLPKAAAIVQSKYGRTIELVVLHAWFPAVAVALARSVPLLPSPSAAATIRNTATPLVIGSAHFGPLFCQLLVLRRLLPRRRVIVVLRARAPYLRKIIPFIRRIGYEFVFDDPPMLLKVKRALREDPGTVVMFAFDHTRRGRHAVPFLGGAIMTSNAVGLLADIGDTRVVSSFWEWNRWRPRVVLDGPYCVDRSLPPRERRRLFRDMLHSIVEAKIAAFPEQWSGWHSVAPSIVAAGPQGAVS